MNSFGFEIIKTFGKYGRVGMVKTEHGSFSTPAFTPVGTYGTVKGLTPEEVRSTGAEVMLSNTYHLHLRPGEAVVAAAGGLASFNNWRGPTITDSGGFQIFSLAKARKIMEEGVEFCEPGTGDKLLLTPEKSIQIQFALGADIIMAFDDLVSLRGDETGREREAMHRTHRWLVRCVAEHKRLAKTAKHVPALFGVVQGGLDPDMRRESIKFIQSQQVSGIAIGGLSVGETRAEMLGVLELLAPLYEPALPRHLLGVGHPQDMRPAIEFGIDSFDCVLPTRNGRHGSAWLTDTENINLTSNSCKNNNNTIYSDCDCYTCRSGYSRAYIRHMFVVNEQLAGNLAARHNLRYLQRILEEYR